MVWYSHLFPNFPQFIVTRIYIHSHCLHSVFKIKKITAIIGNHYATIICLRHVTGMLILSSDQRTLLCKSDIYTRNVRGKGMDNYKSQKGKNISSKMNSMCGEEEA